MGKWLRLLFIIFVALTLVGVIGVTLLQEHLQISAKQFSAGIAYDAGFRNAPHEIPFLVLFLIPDGNGPFVYECAAINCPNHELTEITRKYFGNKLNSSAWTRNGHLTEEYLDRFVSWQQEIQNNRSLLITGLNSNEYCNVMSIDELREQRRGFCEVFERPVGIRIDNRGQPLLLILIWMTVAAIIGSVICLLWGVCKLVLSYRSGETA